MQLEDFEVDSRIGVGGGGDLRGSPSAAVTYYVTYKAMNPASGRMALYWQDIQIRLIAPERQEVAERVELIGQSTPLVIAELGKLHPLGTANPPTQQVRLREIELHDPISDSGQVAFWGLTTSGEQAVFRATPAPGKVLTILTHGFGRDLSDPIGPFKGIFGDEFIDVFHDLADTFEKLPAPGSHLENKVQTYVASWDSSDGWFQAWFTWGTSVIADLISNKVVGTGINGIVMTAALQLSFTALANYLKEVGDLYLENAGRHAEAAAIQIVDDLLESGKLGTPQQTRSLDQIVHLVGHSRGAAVNARVAQILASRGYFVHQFTALDGYSNDWPDGASFLADIDIAGTIRMIDTDPAGGGLGRRDNYRVAEPLHKLVWDWVLPVAQWAAQRYLGVSPSGYSQPLLDLLVRESHDWRAPERRLFPDETEIPQGTESERTVNTVINIVELFDNGALVPKLTDHTTISRAYLQSVEKNAPSHQFALKNYLGEHRCDGAPHCTSPRAEGEPSMGSVIQAILDGNFEKAGILSRKARQLSVPSFNDPLFDGIVKLASDPNFHLSAAWQHTGAVALDTSTDDSFVVMSQHTNGSTLGQMIFIGAAANSLRFDLQTRATAADAELQILFGGELTHSIDLANSPRGLQTIDFSKLAGRSGQLWFRLAGGGGLPVQITLDDIALSEGDTSPLVLNDQLRIDEGRSATFTVLHNDLARGPNIQPASLRIERAPAFGTATVDSQGVIRYVPNPAFRGMDLLEYSVANSTGQRSTFAQVQIEVRTDLPPIAVADYVQLTKGKQATFQPAENDFDPEQKLVLSTIQIASPPSHGSVSVFESGAVRYVPHSDFVGTDSFSYRLADAAGNISSDALVQLEVANAFPKLHITMDDQPWQVGQALHFGQTTTMSTSVRRQVQVRNLGLAPLRIDSASIVGSGFRLLPFDRLPLGQGGELTLFVEMLDQLGGTLQSAQLRLSSNDPLQPLVTIPLLGELAPLPLNAVAGTGRFTSEKTLAESEILIPAGTDFRSMAVMVDLPWESDNQANITLYAPNGTSLALGYVSNPKESFSGPMRILFSDTATRSQPAYQYERYLGRYRPYYAFTDLGSSATEGVWRLSVDRYIGSAETFQWWLIPDLQPTDITLADLPARSARVGEKISFDIQAGSADQQPLFFEMISDDERGAHLDPIHGRFEWLVPENAGPEHEFVVIVRKAEEQWANAVINVSSGQDNARSALGSPDGFIWNASDPDKGLETIEVSFERPTRSYGARIREYGANGFVRKIEARDTDGAYHVVWSDWDPTPSNNYRDMFATWPLTEYTVVSLRISIDTMHVINGQESIDGVALLGLPAQPISKIQEFVLPVTGRPRITEMTPSQSTSLNMLQEVELRFSEAMDRATVEEVRNYVLTDSQGFALRIASASYSENHGFSISLRIDSRSGLRTGQYSLSVMGTALKSAQGISMSKLGTQLMAVVGMDQQAVALEVLSKELRASSRGGFEFGIESSGRFEVADLDSDGVLDMVAMNQRAPTLGFFKGLGSGKYANVQEIALSGLAQEVFIADWDGDGKLDLIVPTALNQLDGSGAVGYDIFINDGRADFSPSPDSPLPFHYGSGPGMVANVLGDSRPEIIQTGYVTLSSGRGGVVLQIIGADRFLGYNIVAELQPPPGREKSSPTQLFVRDFTGDGRMDVMTNNFEFGRDGFVSLYRGKSNGLASYEEVPVDVFRNATLQVDDFNNDGRLDLVALEDRFSINAGITDGNVLQFLKGRGDGTFEQMPEKMLNGRGAGLATVGDVNGDGFSDLVLNVAAYTSPNYTHLKLSDDNALWIWNGDGRGNFQATTPSPIALPDHQHIQPNIVRLAELTGDGLPEILLGSPATSQIGVLKNMGGSLLLPLREWNLRTGFTPQVADARGSTRNGEPGYVLTDLNGDRVDDMLLLGGNAGGLSLEVLLADPLLGYRHAHSMSLGLTVASAWLEAGDVDSDGLIDLIIGDGNQNIVFLKGLGGSGFFQSKLPLPRIPSEVGYGVQDGQLTDVNLDGFLDLIVTVTTLLYSSVSNLGAAVYFGTGDGLFSFNRNTLVTQYQASQVHSADFNGDLFPDLISFTITPNNDMELRFFAGRGNGTFLAGKVSPLQNLYPIDYFRIGDVNRDGYLDLIGSGAVEVLLGDGQGGFQHHRTLANDLVNRWFAGIADVSLGDFDHDGLLDVMIAYYPGRTGINLDTITLFRGTEGLSYLDNGTDIVVGGKPRGANRLMAVDRASIMEVGQFELRAALPPVSLAPTVGVSPLVQQLSGTSTPNANVTVTLEDRVLGVTRAAENGKWILNLENLLPVGVHQLTFSARDNQGRTTEASSQEIEIRPLGLSFDWTNSRDPLDVDNDGVISPLDVLMLVNSLNRDGSRNLPILNSTPEYYYDVNSDESLSPLDVLLVVNFLNRLDGNAEGESQSSPSYSISDLLFEEDQWLWEPSLHATELSDPLRRRRR